MRLAWLTDPHVNFLKNVKAFGSYLLEEQQFDAVVITGDISEAPRLHQHLAALSSGIGNKDIYFVLGNHDYYSGSLSKVRQDLNDFLKDFPNLHYLTSSVPIKLCEDTVLVGDDGWYDATAGAPDTSMVYLSDFELIKELRACLSSSRQSPPDHVFARGDRWPLINFCREQAQLSAARLKPKLIIAAAMAPSVIVATHFPPFEKACWHQGAISDAQWLPWFTNVTMGEMLDQVASGCPDTNFTVLCGHTHSSGTYRHALNLTVHTGKAVYGAPDINTIFELPFAV